MVTMMVSNPNSILSSTCACKGNPHKLMRTLTYDHLAAFVKEICCVWCSFNEIILIKLNYCSFSFLLKK